MVIIMKIINKLILLILISTSLFINSIQCKKELSVQGLHIKGNQIYNADEEMIMLRGVNRPGTEYTCVKQRGVFDGPSDVENIRIIKSWKLNAIRVPLNEDCWLGLHANEAPWFGQGYRDQIKAYVDMLGDENLAVIIDLHWSSKNSTLANEQIPMPNAKQSVEFWKDVARTFKSHSNVIFDLYNEPFPNNNAYDTPEAWQCWKDGTSCTDLGYEAAGMQQLLEAVRCTGAANIVLMAGIQYASSFGNFLQYAPKDSLSPPQIGASLHAYDFNQCKAKGCWDLILKPVADVIPMIATETGQKDCLHDFLKDFLQYCDTKNIHYLAWSWLKGDCNIPSLIENWDGTPSGFGIGYKTHLDRLAKGYSGPYSETFDIYNDKLTHWADDWSSSKPVFNSTEVIPCEGNFSIKFVPKKEKSLHFMCIDCIQTNVHKQLEFWVHGGTVGNQKIKIQFLERKYDNSNQVKQTFTIDQLNGGKPIPPNQWSQIIVPLENEPVETYDGFWLKADDDQPTLYIDKITVRARVEPSGDEESFAYKFNSNYFIILLISSILILLI